MNIAVNPAVLSQTILDNLYKNVLFLDDDRVVIKNMDYYPFDLSTLTGRVIKVTAYNVFCMDGHRLLNMAWHHAMRLIGDAWVKNLSDADKQKFHKMAQYFNDNTREEAETDRKEYYKEVFQSNAQIIRLLPLLPSSS